MERPMGETRAGEIEKVMHWRLVETVKSYSAGSSSGDESTGGRRS